MTKRSRTFAAALCLLVTGVWLAFQSGGFFAGTTGTAAIFFGLACLLWLMLAARPFGSFSAALAVSAGALALFALWTLISQLWSHAPARALIAFDLALLYLLAIAFFGLAGSATAARVQIARAVALTFAAVSISGLITRLLPQLWPVTHSLQIDRLSYPVSYWNAQGAVAALGVIACMHLAASRSEPRVVRALAAGALPLVACALLLTLSRGPILLLPVGLLAYLALARQRGAIAALLVTVPATAVALLVTYDADAVVNQTTPTAASIAAGRTVALVVAVCAVAAAVAMAMLAPAIDARAAAWRGLSRRRWRALIAAAVAVIVVAGLALHVPAEIAGRVRDLGRVHFVPDSADARKRLDNLGDNGRVDQWRVALDAFARQPVLGSGAGTYALLWARDRKIDQDVNNGHSLYLEVLAELGLAGGLLIVLVVGGLLAGSLRCARGPDRGFGALAFGLGLVWAVHAGIDWDWQMPALTLPVLAMMASASGVASPRDDRPPWPDRLPRLIVAISLLALLMTPVGLVRSQRKLDQAAADVIAGRCGDAISAALASNSALSVRPEPFQVLALCDARLGRPDLAVAAAQAALSRDPNSWQLLYGLAVMGGLQGHDPRPLLNEARRADPRSELVADAVRRFRRASTASEWRRLAARTPMPF